MRPPPGAPALSLTPLVAPQLKTELGPLVGGGGCVRFWSLMTKRFRSLAPLGPLNVTLTAFWADAFEVTITRTATTAVVRNQVRSMDDSLRRRGEAMAGGDERGATGRPTVPESSR